MPRLLTGLVAALVLAGCGSTASTRITSNSLSIYTSLPLHGDRAAEGAAVLRGEKLALQEAGGRVGELKVGLVALDVVEPKGERWSPGQAAANARDAARNPTTIAYIGELDSGATAVSLPITNETGVLQVSPLSALTGLTRPADKGEPDKYYPAASRTFARLVPSGAVEAAAMTSWMADDDVERVAVATDGGPEGLGAVRDLERAMRDRGMELVDLVRIDASDEEFDDPATDLVRAPVQAVVYAGSSVEAAGLLLRAVHRLAPGLPLYATSGVARPALADGLGPAGDEVRVVTPMLDLSRGPAAARRMAQRYRAVYGEDPPPAALYGYEAMRGVLQAVRDAGADGNDRPAVAAAFLRARRADSVLGPYAFDARGDTSRTTVAGFRIRSGKWQIERLLDGRAR